MKGIRSVIIGMHNPLFHGFFVTLAWKKIYKHYPSVKELVCILLHDIGYVKQNFIDGNNDKHPELGAQICGYLFGKKYYNLCIAHSRDYARKLGLHLSKLGYADKYSVLLIPNIIYKPLIYLGGEAQEYLKKNKITKTWKWGYPISILLIKEDYYKWWLDNKKYRNTE